MKILIVDPHVLFREGLVSLLEKHRGWNVVGEAGTIREAVQKSSELKPDLVLLETHLPDGNGVEAIQKILARKPDTIVLVLTNYDSEDLFISVLRSGAKGYLDKRIPTANLVRAIEAIERGEAAVSRIKASRLVAEIQKLASEPKDEEFDLDVLTPREIDVLRLLAANATNKEIADCLAISENTVKVHVHNILDKLNVRNRFQAARLARQRGMAPPNN